MGSMMKDDVKEENLLVTFKKLKKKRLKSIIAQADELICGINAALPPVIRGFDDDGEAAQKEWLLPDKVTSTKVKKEKKNIKKAKEIKPKKESKDDDDEGEESGDDEDAMEHSDSEEVNEEIKQEENVDNKKNERAKTIDELVQRLATLKGKKTDYAGKVLKKGLKNRIKKKQKLELRKKQKQLLRKQNSAQEKTEMKPTVVETKPKAESEGKILFNKIAFTDNEELERRRKPISDPKRALQVIEKKKKKLKELESKGKGEKVKHIKKKEQWDTAIQRAEGVKVKDNVELLKKSIKKKEQIKKRSKKKWDERQQNLEKKKDETQKKRKENIAAKKKKIKQTKIKKSVKKGRVVL